MFRLKMYNFSLSQNESGTAGNTTGTFPFVQAFNFVSSGNGRNNFLFIN